MRRSPTGRIETQSDVELLDSIFTIATAHDSKCQGTEDEFYRYVG